MKNNTFRRLLAMAAAGAMLTSIAACGSSSNDDTASNGSDSTCSNRDTLWTDHLSNAGSHNICRCHP